MAGLGMQGVVGRGIVCGGIVLQACATNLSRMADNPLKLSTKKQSVSG